MANNGLDEKARLKSDGDGLKDKLADDILVGKEGEALDQDDEADIDDLEL